MLGLVTPTPMIAEGTFESSGNGVPTSTPSLPMTSEPVRSLRPGAVERPTNLISADGRGVVTATCTNDVPNRQSEYGIWVESAGAV
jgi:hypothetical protein